MFGDILKILFDVCVCIIRKPGGLRWQDKARVQEWRNNQAGGAQWARPILCIVDAAVRPSSGEKLLIVHIQCKYVLCGKWYYEAKTR